MIMLLRSKDEQGSALAGVILALVIVSLLLAGMATLFQSNLTQTTVQRDSMETYYLAVAGSELCFAALTKEGVDHSVIDGIYDTMLYDMFNTDDHPIGDTLDDLTLVDTVYFSEDGQASNEGEANVGKVDLLVEARDINDERWVTITSTATLSGENLSRTVTLQFAYDNPYYEKNF